jgi:hypothetical protein
MKVKCINDYKCGMISKNGIYEGEILPNSYEDINKEGFRLYTYCEFVYDYHKRFIPFSIINSNIKIL